MTRQGAGLTLAEYLAGVEADARRRTLDAADDLAREFRQVDGRRRFARLAVYGDEAERYGPPTPAEAIFGRPTLRQVAEVAGVAVRTDSQTRAAKTATTPEPGSWPALTRAAGARLTEAFEAIDANTWRTAAGAAEAFRASAVEAGIELARRCTIPEAPG